MPMQALSMPSLGMVTRLVSDNVQAEKQEVEVRSYLVGQIDSEVDTDDLSNFDFRWAASRSASVAHNCFASMNTLLCWPC